jgi:hypothetical protein
MEPVFDDRFFREVRQRLELFYEGLERIAVIGVVLFIIGIILAALQQIILILLFPFR